jgi:hypothetical protein
MAVKLKFQVVSQTQQKAWNGPGLIGSVRLTPVTGTSDENKSFYEATPGGSIEFSTINETALKSLPIGAQVYVTLEVAGADA